MTKRVLWLFGFLVWAFPAFSETVKVNANEQASLTRIAIAFEQRPKWTVERMGRRHRLRFSTSSVFGFDLSAAFRTMNRERIADIRVLSATTLEFDVSCDCGFDVFGNASGHVIVEVADRFSGSEDSSTEVPVFAPPHTDTDMPKLPSSSDGAVGRPNGANPMLPDRDPVLNVLKPEVASLPFLIGELDLQNQMTDQSVAVGLIGRAFSRAALQGLVAADGNIVPRLNASQLPTNISVARRSNLSVSTVFDPIEIPETRFVPPTPAGSVCISDRDINVPFWGDIDDLRRLGRLRLRMIAEDGTIDPKGAFELARLYIWMGFGAEADDVMSFYPPGPDQELINALAELMDFGGTQAEVLSGQLHCQGAISLWGALSREFTPQEAPETANHILTAFNALPTHLRTHLGPTLSERLHAGGLENAAQTALNAVARGGKETDESTLATARLDLGTSRATEARGSLADLSNGTDVTAASALLELLQDAERRDMPPNPAWVDDAPTLVEALEGTREAKDLNVAGLRGLISLERFDEFRAAVVEDSPGLTGQVRMALAEYALEVAVMSDKEDAFLRLEIAMSKQLKPTDLSDRLKQNLARRLVDLGLPGRALRYTEKEPQSEQELTNIAEALGALGRRNEAVDLLRSTAIEGQDVLLADALYAAGDFRGAVEAFRGVGEDERAAHAALRIGDWDWIERHGSDQISMASRQIRADPPIAEIETPNGALIENSRSLRESVNALLNATQPKDTSNAFTN
jgi:tetratricopeptide (TPR) repeat protein